jgi:hypothetical protein
MARFNANNGSAHELAKDIKAFRFGASARRQNAQRRAIAHATGIPGRGRRVSPLWERRIEGGESLHAYVRSDGVIYGYNSPSELDGKNLFGKDAIR